MSIITAMKLLVKPFQLMYALYAMLLFLLIMFLVLPFVIIASLFGKYRGGNAVMQLAHWWADVWLLLIGIRHERIVESEPDPNRPYIFISNHNSYMDIPQLLKAIRRPLRVLGKAEMGKVPVFGFIYNAAVVPVKRSSAADRARSMHMLRSILSRNISIFIAPEGTFNTSPAPLARFYDGAFRLAIETQTPIQPLLFLDAVDRLHWKSIFSLTPGRLRTVYLPAVSPEGYTPYDVAALRDHVHALMEQKLLQYRPSWIRAADAQKAS